MTPPGKHDRKMKRKRNASRNRGTAEPLSETDGKYSSPWKKVDAGLASSSRLVLSGNHYDDDRHHVDSEADDHDLTHDTKCSQETPSQFRSAEEDLEASAEEGMGFFYGLEVISADQYTVETDPSGVKHFHLLSNSQSIAVPPPKAQQQQHVDESDSLGEDEDLIKEKYSAAPTLLDGALSLSNEHKGKDFHSFSIAHADQELAEKMQLSWLAATGGVSLHPRLCHALVQQGFWSPTPIQASTLPASILGKQNVVGAAPTGSGKTLSFLLPIYEELLEELDAVGDDQGKDRPQNALRALVLAPTRELALQIHASCEQLLPKTSAAVVGGMAVAKQNRLLDRFPPVVIGTPGRLWDLVSNAWKGTL